MVMQLTVSGATVQRQFPYTASNMNLFADLASTEAPCPGAITPEGEFQPLAMNADGSVNSCANPARYGSTVSFFMEGVGGDIFAFGFEPPQQVLNVQALLGSCSAAVTNASLIDDFVYRVDVTLPPSLLPCSFYSSSSAEGLFYVTLRYNGSTVGRNTFPFPPAFRRPASPCR
jgi:uncharacterized protein (TIGR03437 family)